MENYLFLGNPGTGKSTLINCLVGSPVFNSGVNYDGGLTKAFQKHIHDNVQYLDTPGLADRAIQDTAAEITEALKLSGTYKLFFMVRLESGRVVNDDLATIEVVLRSIQNDNVPFAIIVNNVKKRQYAKLKKNGGDYEEIAKMLHSIKYKTPHIVFIPVIDALYEEDNAITELPSDVEAFIRSEAPTVEIDPKTVQPIKIEDFHKVSEKLREMQENLLKENAILERKIEQLSMEPHVGGGLLGTLGRLMALNPSRSTPKDQDNAQAKILTAGGFTKDSTMNATPPVLPESVENPQWGEAFTSDSESENKSVVSTAGCLTNWIWAGFEMAKNFVKEQTKRWFGQFRRWWKPQQCKSESSDRDHLQDADSNSTSAYSQLSTFQDGITHGGIAHKTFAAAQGKTKVDLSAKDTVVDIPFETILPFDNYGRSELPLFGKPWNGQKCVDQQPCRLSGCCLWLGFPYGPVQSSARNVQYLGTPGLAYGAIDATTEITQALKQSGKYKLFFVLRLEYSCVGYGHLATIEVVLRSIGLDNVSFTVIVNNVEKRRYAEIMKRGSEYEQVVKLINTNQYKTPHVVFIPVIDVLNGRNNAITKLPSDVEEFIRSEAPTVRIDPKIVQPIEIKDFHKVSKRLRQVQDNLLMGNVILKRKIEQLSKKPNSIHHVALIPSGNACTQDDNSQMAAPDSVTKAAASVVSERIDSPQFGVAFTSDSGQENEREVGISRCMYVNWFRDRFNVAKSFFKEQSKRSFRQLKRWWEP